MPISKIHHIKTITEFHRFRQLPNPEHPLISVVKIDLIKYLQPDEPMNLILDFYIIALKRIDNNGKFKYGQLQYDFDEGIMSFMSPKQVFSISLNKDGALEQSGWALLLHPDFIWNTSLAKTIKQYAFFGYAVNEALFLSEKEERTIIGILRKIRQEYESTTDHFSQNIQIALVETLLQYADRFYHRQFLTRKKANHQILDRFERLLTDAFNDNNLVHKGPPSVQYLSKELNISESYLSRLLKTLTGQTTQQHIHEKLIEKAKEKLSTTALSVSEIAYELGFEHAQSFNKLFKSKTQRTPLAFRRSFN